MNDYFITLCYEIVIFYIKNIFNIIKAKIEIFTEAFAPHLLQIISIHKNIIQLNTNPQSSAIYSKLKSSLFAIKFAQTTESVKNKIESNKQFELIIPNATSIQNARTSVLGDTITRDGFHMSYDLGRYITGLMFVKKLLNLDIDNITYCPEGVTEEQKEIAIKAVNYAYNNPYQITNIK